MQRYVALDSWRGLCALLVVLFHLNQDANWSLHGAHFLGNFALFVDFFFVLSGFVIAASYEDRLKQGYGFMPFMIRRFGRIYPLHLAMLIAMILYAIGRVLLPLSAFNPRAVFDGGLYDFSAIFTNLLLLQGIGFENHLTWNYPSWSISTEFFTYIIFALIWCAAPKLSRWLTFALLIACPIALMLVAEDTPSAMTLVRCVFGFAAGVAVQHLCRRAGPMPELLKNKAVATALEVAVLALCIGFIGFTPGEIWIAPIVFATVVFVFAFEAGAMSSLLKLPPFLTLGTLSYSIYMVHAFLIALAWRAVTLTESFGGISLSVPKGDGSADRLWGATTIWGDAAVIVMLVLVVAFSAATYTLIEKPGRDWGRDASKRWRAGGWSELLRARSRTAAADRAD